MVTVSVGLVEPRWFAVSVGVNSARTCTEPFVAGTVADAVPPVPTAAVPTAASPT